MSIIVNHVDHIYNPGTVFETKALSDVTFKIEDGEYVGLVGHTGSGKSTLVQHLNGLMKPTSGAIYYNGIDIASDDFNMKELRGKVGLVFQYPEHQLFEEDVFTDVCFGPKNLGFGKDPKGRDEILAVADGLHDSLGITVIIVSHSMDDLAEHADRILVMNDGMLLMDGATREVFGHRELLESIGLGVPEVTAVMSDLKKMGLHISDDAITVEEAVRELRRVFGR